jgi:cytochrome oxidase assembly protein ShyY1
MLPAFQALSNWQWHRLQDRQVVNAEIQAQINKEPIPITELIVDIDGAKSVPEDSQWRTVEITGVWLQDNQVLVRKKSLESDLGLWVVTPLQLADGTIVMINRGWTAAANSAVDSPVVSDVPIGTIEVLGRLRDVTERTKPAPTDLPEGQVDRIVPTEIVDSPDTLTNAYVEMTASRPESRSTEIRSLPAPEVTEGAHRSYAIQWIFFEIMTVIGWIILVRNEVKEQRKAAVS